MNFVKYVLIRNVARRNKISPLVTLRGACQISTGVTLRHGVVVDGSSGPVRIAGGCWVDSLVRIKAAGVISIGENCTINRMTTISGDIEIGNECLIAPNVFISSGNHRFRDRRLTIKQQDRESSGQQSPIVLGSDVWVGVNAVIGPGVKIGDGAVIGAGAVVTKPVDDYSIMAGVPARKIGERE